MSHELSVLAGSAIVLLVFVGGFLFVFWKDQWNLKIIPEAIKGFFVRLYEIFFLGIADREAYDANKGRWEKDEAYKKKLKERNNRKRVTIRPPSSLIFVDDIL